ncbi:MAG TPA: hypothetical protein VJ183_00905 [Chloroflexia bacterium]|nr:hypothetical protein [Chloroflexia bacterium]
MIIDKKANNDTDNSIDDEAAPDVAAILSDLREQIRERRAHFTVSDPNDPHALNLAELRRSMEAVNDTWYVSAHLPITWELRVVGRLGSYIKRAVRVLLRWYINPIVEQQNRFNQSVARSVTEMYAYQERMAREWQLLDERVADLEGKVESKNS